MGVKTDHIYEKALQAHLAMGKGLKNARMIAARAMRKHRADNLTSVECQQPMADRHRECSGKFLVSQGSNQTICVLCQAANKRVLKP